MLEAGDHQRFDPRTKDVFYVCHDGGDTVTLSDGSSYVKKNMHTYGYGNVTHPSITFHKLHKEYLSEPFKGGQHETHGWINTNSDDNPDIDKTYAIRIRDYGFRVDETDGVFGTCPRSRPLRDTLVKVYSATIQYAKSNSTYKKDGKDVKRYENVTLEDMIKSVLAHEVAHGLNLHHCPLSCYQRHKTCVMRPSLNKVNDSFLDENGEQTQVFDLNINVDVSPEHYVDYDLAGQNKNPRRPYDDPENERPRRHRNDKPKSEKLQGTLTPSNDLYTASGGDRHTANFTTPSPYSSVHWYVKSPTDTSDLGTNVEIDAGDGSSTTASLDYTFPTDAVAGAYVITAYVYTVSGEVYEVSYTVTVGTVPGAPHNFSVQGTNGGALLYWRAPSDSGSSAITSYQYSINGTITDADGGSWSTWQSSSFRKSSRGLYYELLSGLTNGTVYGFKLRAVSAAGNGTASAVVRATPRAPRIPPRAPRALSAVGGNGSVELSWQPPESDGNSPITRYEYRYGIGTSVTPENYTGWASMSSAMATYLVSPLTNNMSHIFEVRAVNAIGNSAPSAPATATPRAPTIPGRPTGLTSAASNGTVTLRWTAPTDDGGG